MNDDRPELSREEFVLIQDFINRMCGICFPENKKHFLESCLQKRMVAVGVIKYSDYLLQLTGETSPQEFNRLINLVTAKRTSFYRDPMQLRCFQDEILPLVIADRKRRGRKSLRLWSAGCSSGEEPYTLAMILLDVLGEQSGWELKIIANDISDLSLQTARNGVYSEQALRTTPPESIRRHFVREANSFRVTEPVKRLVSFGHINLADSKQTAMLREFDFAFCRNVLMYFSDDVKRRLVHGFYNSLVPGGYLFVSHAESLQGISRSFKPLYFRNGLVYQRQGSELREGVKRSNSESTATATARDRATEYSEQPTKGA